MLQVDVENNRVVFCAEGIPLHEPLLANERTMASKKKSIAFGCFLLSVATLSTIIMVSLYALYPGGADIDSDFNATNAANGTSYLLPFEVSGPFDSMGWVKEQQVETTNSLERFALMTLFVATTGAHWKESFEFLSLETSVCEWNDGSRGVFCDENHRFVQKVILDGFALEGTIPSEVAFLTRLEVLHLGNNQLDGDLPTSMASMESLRDVVLNDNSHGFAGNVNQALCKGDENYTFETLILGGDCPLPVCLCCTDCPN